MTKRNYMWDNIKGFLIISVVVGHLLHSFDCPDEISYKFAYWIYTFHMPAFLFVSGYWATSYCKKGVTKPEKVACLIGYYFVFQILFLLVDILFFNPEKDFSFGDAMLGLWYLSALIFYYLFLPLFEKLTPLIGILITIFLSIFIGFDKQAGDYFSISRTFVFAPYFFIGYYTSDSAIAKLRNFKLRYIVGIFAILLSISLWLFAEYIFSPTFLDDKQMISQLIFYGNFNYHLLGLSNWQGIILRMFSYLVSSLMIVGILFISPKSKSLLSHTGKNSLQIYIFHLIPVLIFIRLKSDGIIILTVENIWTGFILILSGILLSLLLSCKVFSYPFTLIQKTIYKLSYLALKHK